MKNNLLKNLNKFGFKLKKHSPEILVIAGVVGAVTSTVMACKATTKLSTILENAKSDVDAIHESINNPELAEEYTEEIGKRDLTITYAKTGVSIAKLYGPSVILGVLSLTSIVASNNILKKRNIALAAAYTTIDRGFKEYRSRVVERFGEKADKELKFNIKAKDIETTIVDDKGKEKKQKETIEVAEVMLDGHSDYAKFFDVGNPNWEKDSEYNLLFLKQQEAYANEKLRNTGRLFLNEVYRMLGLPETKAGQVVGWVYDKEEPTGDNFVDFGIYEESSRDFVNGYERSIILDFNVDGNIWDLM